jgi:hypothetical protein
MLSSFMSASQILPLIAEFHRSASHMSGMSITSAVQQQNHQTAQQPEDPNTLNAGIAYTFGRCCFPCFLCAFCL